LLNFRTVRYRNILSTGNAFIEINMDEARSTLCHGVNGAGKSTFIEAISFALYGKSFRKTNKPQLVNSINKKDMLVEIEFVANNREYMIRRGMKPNIFEIFENGKLLNQESATKDYQEILEKSILKMNHKSFSQIVVLGSANYTPFMQLSASARRDLIEDLLDIQVFSTMNILLKDKISAAKEDLTTVRYNIDITKEKIELQKEYIRKIRQNAKTVIKEKKAKIKENNLLVNAYTDKISEILIEIEKCNRAIADSDETLKKKSTMVDMQRQIQSKIAKIIKEISFYDENKTCPMCKQGIDHDFHSDIQDENRKKENEFRSAATLISKKILEIDKKIDVIHGVNNEIQGWNLKIAGYNQSISGVNKYTSELQKEILELQNKEEFDDNELQKLEELTETLTKYESQKEEILAHKATLDVASMILKDGGIKSKIIKQYIPVINKLINKYLAQMEFVVDFNLDENFNETIKSRYRDEFSYASFSEGEKARIDVALLFTWRAISKLRNSNNTNILVLDEIGDSSLDSSGAEEFIKILQDLAGDTNIFMISHRAGDIQDKFDRTIEFVKDKNFTRLV